MSHAPAAEITFQLQDAWGQTHSYMVMPHPYEDGMKLSTQLARIVGPSLLKMYGDLIQQLAPRVSVLMAQQEAARKAEDSAEVERIENALQEIWTEALAKFDIAGNADRILANLQAVGGFETIIPSLLKLTFRDSLLLKDSAALGMCYQRNYTEQLWAAWEVVKANGFLPLPRI